MSDELKNENEILKNKNESLKQLLAQNNNNVAGLVAQLEAHKQMLNDSLNTGLQLRTNLILFQKNNQELSERLEAANKSLLES